MKKIISTIKSCHSKWLTFSGRASVSEFWIFEAYTILISVLAFSLLIGINKLCPDSVLLRLVLFSPVVLYLVLIFTASLSLSVRRLHDAGRSAWWLLLIDICITALAALIDAWVYDRVNVRLLNPITLLFCGFMPGQPWENIYGLPPKRKGGAMRNI